MVLRSLEVWADQGTDPDDLHQGSAVSNARENTGPIDGGRKEGEERRECHVEREDMERRDNELHICGNTIAAHQNNNEGLLRYMCG